MKFEDFLMQSAEEKKKRLHLEEEVVKLQGELDQEQKLHRVLQCALHRPLDSHSSPPSLLTLQIQVLLAEIAMVEEEIMVLERKVEYLKVNLYQEKKYTETCMSQQGHFLRRLRNRSVVGDLNSPDSDFSSQRLARQGKSSLASGSEVRALHSTRLNDKTLWSHKGYAIIGDEAKRSGRSNEHNQNQKFLNEESTKIPNKVSEELIKCLINIFHQLNQTAQVDYETSGTVPKLTLPCLNTKSFMTRTSLYCKTPILMSDDQRSRLDPYGLSPDVDGTNGEANPYKKFIHCTRRTLDLSQISQCLPEIEKLRVLMHELCSMDLSLLTYKQKLAFWINTYNACVMHAFLQFGLPSTPDKLLTLMNKAAVNVGGIVLNALAIEHFILRHPCDSRNAVMGGKEELLFQAYGLGYPEPNITFALCRGSWSSPALRVYSADEVTSELERAKVQYLEASVGVVWKKKIVVPKLLHWHMHDFADSSESLLEWIYSQLPRWGVLKRSIMECLNADTKLPIKNIVEVQPYESEFRYLLPF